MAVAAYQSLISLSNLLENVYDRIEIQFPRLDSEPFDPLREGVNFLLELLEAHSQRKSQKLDDLWRQISKIVQEADNIIDKHVVDQLLKESKGEERYMGHSTFNEDMDRVKHKIEDIKKELLIAIEGGEDIKVVRSPKVSLSTHASSSTASHGKDIVVGLDKDVINIMNELANNEFNLQIITITGMGGIGKTTLAKSVYDRPFIVEHFVVRLWVVISQEYTVENVLKRLLDSGENKFHSDLRAVGQNRKNGESISELRGKLHRELFDRRYLVVLDDVWSAQVWDDLGKFFPNDGNGSRIMMTTRDAIVASFLSSGPNPNKMDFLGSEDSWDLLRQTVFSQGVCPNPELEEVGKNIAEGCKGLPLSIVVIGSMLASSEMTQEYWEFVAKDVNSFRDLGDDGHCLEILSLSYNNLPIYLKSCLLYMRTMKDGHKMSVPLLVGEWITQGLIKLEKGKDLELEARKYLAILVSRNLILADQHFYGYENSPRCRVHDLVRELCKRESEKENCIRSAPTQVFEITQEKKCLLCHRLCGSGNEEELNYWGLLIPPSSSHVIPFMCIACAFSYAFYKGLSLDSFAEYFCQDILLATKIQSICVIICVKVPAGQKLLSPSLAQLLWRLQNLYISSSNSTTPMVLPLEIWKMPQLRSIGVERSVLSFPAVTDIDGKDFIILKYLHTLSGITNFMCTEEVVCRIPNLQVLAINNKFDSSPPNYSLCNLAKLHKLECLMVDTPIYSPENIAFPDTLITLVLQHTKIPWKDMTIIGSLPNLAVLSIDNAFIGPEWNPAEGEFRKLRILMIESTDLLCWTADTIHFPKLEELELRGMLQLEIPSNIGDIPTLKRIYLRCCSRYVIDSANQIWDEQQGNGNEMLRVFVTDEDGTEYKIGD